jgi:hypothetical protein
MSDPKESFFSQWPSKIPRILCTWAKAVKINAGAVQPYDIVKTLNNGSVQGKRSMGCVTELYIGNTEWFH